MNMVWSQEDGKTDTENHENRMKHNAHNKIKWTTGQKQTQHKYSTPPKYVSKTA